MFAQSQRSYRRVSTDSLDEKQPETNQHRGPFLLVSRNVLVLAVVTMCGIAIFMALGLHQIYARNGKTPSHNHSNPSGNSSAEALSLGCSFDQLMWAWLPRHCPHYANDLYLNAEPEKPWQFYVNPYTKELATDEDWNKALDNEVLLYGERREHLAHCVFMFLNLAQIIRDGGSYIPKHVDYEHLDRCSNILLEALKMDSTRYGIETFAGAVSFDQNCKG